MKNFYQKGITVVEVLIVLAVIGIIITVTLPQFSKIKENQILKSSASDILSSLNRARSETLASVNSSEYGVHFQSDRVIIFKGKIFSALAVDNETILIEAPASITDVTFGGVSGEDGDVYFSRLYGAPSTTGTITISSPSFSKIITISATGATSIN